MRAARVITGVVCVSALLARAPFERPAFADGPAPADASRKLACIAADTDGQALRLKDELRAARSRFKACATDTCPKIVREDCFERIAEVARAQPMIVFDATNGHGRTLRAVTVLVDEQALTEKLDGRPLAVDPGEHTFTFSALGRAGDNLHLTLSEGARERRAVVLRTLSETPEAIKPGPPLYERFEEEPSPAPSVPPA